MKLYAQARLLFEVDTERFKASVRSRDTLNYLLGRLFSGEVIAESELQSWGITVLEVQPEDDDMFVRIPRMEEK